MTLHGGCGKYSQRPKQRISLGMLLEYTIVGCLFLCTHVLHNRFTSWSTSLIQIENGNGITKSRVAFFFSFLVGGLTLFCWSMAFAHWSMLSLLTPFEQTWYHGWLFSWGGLGEGRTGRQLVDAFLLLAIKVFGCLHQHVDNFFY